MKYLWPKQETASIVVIPADHNYDGMGRPKPGHTPAIRAEFVNHYFDTDSKALKAQFKAYQRWCERNGQDVPSDDALRALVEEALHENESFGRFDGFKAVDDTMTQVHVTSSTRNCIGIVTEEDGSARVCGEPVAPGEQFHCATHAPVKEGAGVSG